MWKLRLQCWWIAPCDLQHAWEKKPNHHFLLASTEHRASFTSLTEINVKISTCKENIYSKPFEAPTLWKVLSVSRDDWWNKDTLYGVGRGKGGHIWRPCLQLSDIEGMFLSISSGTLSQAWPQLYMLPSISLKWWLHTNPYKLHSKEKKKSFYVANCLSIQPKPTPGSALSSISLTRHWSPMLHQALCYLGALPAVCTP